MLKGYEQRVKMGNQKQAWTVSHLLIAAGCDAAKVTPAKLLGQKERRPRQATPEQHQLPVDEIYRKMRGEA